MQANTNDIEKLTFEEKKKREEEHVALVEQIKKQADNESSNQK